MKEKIYTIGKDKTLSVSTLGTYPKVLFKMKISSFTLKSL
jgi:hypothetical protein